MCFLVQVENIAQGNNQWDIGAAVGSDPMQSNFARALRGGIKGVAMVLDQEVQPLTSDSTKCGACHEVQGFRYIVMYLSLSHSFFYFVARPSKLPK